MLDLVRSNALDQLQVPREKNIVRSVFGMRFEGWYLLLGGLMLAVTFLDHWVRRLPVTTTIVYLVCGLVIGPLGLGLAHFNPVEGSEFLERVTEVAVIVSLFTAGLKLRAPLTASRWKIPVLLAFLSMVITVFGIAAVAVLALNLPWGAGILLGGILAPTDPVLASDVQLSHPGDRDRLRFSLTAEAGLNDGTAFPFVLLGLGILGIRNTDAWEWLARDFVWATFGGLAIGATAGTMVGKVVILMRTRHEEMIGRNELISLGLIGIAYGIATYAHAFGFLAVFSSGVALRRIELLHSGEQAHPVDRSDVGIDVTRNLAAAVLTANEQVERLLEIGLVLLLGAMLSREYISIQALGLSLTLFIVIRPLSVWLSLIGARTGTLHRMLLGWFGIRGIGSLYYLMFAIQRGLDPGLSKALCELVLSTVVISILAHGVSVTPIMNAYERRKKERDRS